MKQNLTPFHLVKPSFWPLFTSIFAFTVFLCIVVFMHKGADLYYNFIFSLVCLLWTTGSWWFDICIEGFRGGYHTSKVRHGLRMAMALFIVSEAMFFFSFFWAFFSASLSPVYNIGGVWPPVGIKTINPLGVPLLNTFLLLTSGATITRAHNAIQKNDDYNVVVNLNWTVFFALFFTRMQVLEYRDSNFNISDSVYGSLFYVMTGFHGLHVVIGTCFILVCFFRFEAGHFSRKYHFGFEAAIWYWHFVDVVWILLYICLYWWGGNLTY